MEPGRRLHRRPAVDLPADANGNGLDAATVLLEAPADKVYEAAVANIRQHQDAKITKAHAANLTVEFTNGKQSASMVATSLGRNAQMNVECKVGH